MISQAAEYALRAMLLLALRSAPPLTTSQIAAQTRIPGGYLSKVLQTLVRSGLLISQRGVNGGFVLSRPPESLTMMDIVTAIDPSHRVRSCPLTRQVKLCPLHRRIDAAVAAAEHELRRTTLADLIDQQKQTPACHDNLPSDPAAAGSQGTRP